MGRIIADLSSEFARTGRTRTRFFTPEIAHAMRLARKYRMQMADGLFYHDTRSPFLLADAAAVTLATTDKALYTAAAFPNLGSQYWWAGKTMWIHMLGRITTVVTPGNGTWDVYWGSGADANGTIIGSSQAHALTASQTNMSWELDIYIRCRSTGATGTFMTHGVAIYNEAVAAPKQLIPASAPATVTVDTTLNNIISVQYKRSGSTAETMTVHELMVMSLN